MRARWPLLVASLLLTSCGSDAEAPTTDGEAERSPSTGTSEEAPPWTDISEEGGEALPVDDADWLQVAGGSVWTTLSGVAGASVQQLDAASGDPGASVRTPADTCTAMDVGYGSLWAAVCSDPSSLVRIDPDDGRVLARIRLDGVVQYEGSVASAEGSVWAVTTTPRHSLVRIDPRTNRVVRTTPLPVGVTAVRAGLGGLWATNAGTGELLRLDPRTGKTVATIEVGNGARFFAVGEGAVWVQNNVDGTVSRVDPRTNSVVATIEVDDGVVDGGDLAVGGGFVWARVSSWLVSKIDPATNSVVARYGPPAGSGSVAADDAAVWISAHDVDLVYRLPLQ